MKKILVFGGTFNPVHNGHIYMCRQIADSINADLTLIIPTFSPVHKNVDNSLVSSEHRLNMCKLAFDRENEVVSTIEIEKGRPCYSYETLTWIQDIYPDAQLYLACGSDMFLSLHTWRNPQIIFEKAIICAVARDNDRDKLVDYAKIHCDNGLNSIIIDCQSVEVSSTEIRQALKLNNATGDLLPQKVEDYIRKHGIYL